ncbi:Uncharacterized protein GY17_00001926 [Cryptosporidium hominis]|uniref:Uncharacterized protein n=1 Tax=Cryptosporidium hominis TaxID=237895 RepID=A0ABX5BBN1_CRYHO|nr:Uncharacterized protein GY17_00001926 [Cryptosporidium hominis]|eukprot:PPS94870.1 Uncharacterized protein GY17_00001926 [Cryptosporidium hominis]
MPYIYNKGFKWFFTATLVFIFGLLILSSRAEEIEGEDIVQLVENDHKQAEGNNQESQKASEKVVELEGADLSDETSEVQNPEQIYEACASLQESFEKECSGESMDKSLKKLVEVCSDPVPDVQEVLTAASEIARNYSDSSLSETTECCVMIYTTSLYISSNSQTDEQEDDGSLEIESLETDDSQTESEFENN